MFDQTLTSVWRMWVDLVGGLGLPWDKQTSAYLGLVLALYLIGLGFKFLVARK